MSEQVRQEDGQAVEPGLWTVAQAAQYLQISTVWLYKHAAAGLVPVVRLGRNLRFRKADLDAWAASSTKKTG